MIQRADAPDVKVYVARRNRILTKLAILAEATTGMPPADATVFVKPTVRIDRNDATQHRARVFAESDKGSRGRPTKVSKLPAGTRLDRKDGPPGKDEGLFIHYRWRFGHEVKSLDYGHLLCTEAERDHDEYVHGRQQVSDLSAEQGEQVLRNCRGKSPAEVALWYRCDLLYVIRLRSAAGLDPETGLEPGEAPEVGRRRAESPSAVAEELLRSLLADGPRPASVIFTRAEEVGIGAATVKRVKARMGVESQKCAEGWRWKMPRRRAVASPTG